MTDEHRLLTNVRIGLGALLTVLALWLALTLNPNPASCPHGSTLTNTSLEEVCNRPGGSVDCVLSGFGELPQPGMQGYGAYLARPVDGPWCKNAHAFSD